MSWTNNSNVKFTVRIYGELGIIIKKVLPPLILSIPDYETFVENTVSRQVRMGNIYATNEQPTTTIQALETEVKIILSKNTTGTQSCVSFNIVCENGAHKENVILSSDDFNLLKDNVRIFAVLNIQTITSTPNTTYAELGPWIASNSITQVPNTGT